MLDSKNKVSIIIPCYNDGVYLREAVESVLECDKNLYEIIIVDDGSTDKETIKIIKELEEKGIKICRTPHRGQSAGRNEGVKISKYPYLLFLDADNKITQELLEKGINILDRDSLIGIVYSDYIQFGLSNNIIRQKDFDINKVFFLECSVDTCAVIRREVFDNCLGFDESMDFWEDWEFSINAHKNKWKFFHIPKALYYYRIKGDSVNAKSKIKEKRIKILEYVLKKHFDLVPEAMDSKSVLMQDKSNRQILSELAQEKAKNLELETYIENIKRSLTWKMLCGYDKVLSFLLPEGSFLRKLYNKLIIYNQKLINKKRDSLAKKNISSENFWQEFYANNFRPDIVFINHEESLTGAPKVLFEVAKFISSRFDIAIVSNKSGSMSRDFLNEFGHKVIHPNQIYFNTDKDSIARDILTNLNPKVVYLNTIVNLEYAKEAKKLNIPVILHIHELKEVFSIYLDKKEIENVKNLGDIFIVPSLAVKNYLISIGCLADKITILNEMIDIDEIMKKKIENKDEAIFEIGKKEGQILVSASGTLIKRKGPDLFFEAYMILKNKYPGRFRFFWLGSAPIDPKIFFGDKQEENFLFLGEKKNPYPFINESDIFVLPSREDPFPLVVLEAISMAKPVVAFRNSGGATEAIKNCGVLAENFSSQSLAEKIEFLSDNLNLRKKMSEIAKKESLKYNSKILCEKVHSIISNFFDKEVYKVKKDFNKGKKVSVIVPSLNYEEFLPQALDSIISQTYRNWEIIVVDDGSTDNSVNIVNNYIKRYPDKIKLIVKKTEEKGLGFSYDMGVKASSGEYVAFLEADDMWLKDNLEKRMKIFSSYSEVICVFGNAKIFGEERAVKKREKDVIFHFKDINLPKQSPFFFGDLIKKKIAVRTFSATVVRKDALKNIKFSNDFYIWFDWWFHVQLSSKGKYFYIPEKNTLWRVHGDNYTTRFLEEDSWQAKFLEVKKRIESF
jgi:glycosyltransferase involved in cell wall biosynthesis